MRVRMCLCVYSCTCFEHPQTHPTSTIVSYVGFNIFQCLELILHRQSYRTRDCTSFNVLRCHMRKNFKRHRLWLLSFACGFEHGRMHQKNAGVCLTADCGILGLCLAGGARTPQKPWKTTVATQSPLSRHSFDTTVATRKICIRH